MAFLSVQLFICIAGIGVLGLPTVSHKIPEQNPIDIYPQYTPAVEAAKKAHLAAFKEVETYLTNIQSMAHEEILKTTPLTTRHEAVKEIEVHLSEEDRIDAAGLYRSSGVSEIPNTDEKVLVLEIDGKENKGLPIIIKLYLPFFLDNNKPYYKYIDLSKQLTSVDSIQYTNSGLPIVVKEITDDSYEMVDNFDNPGEENDKSNVFEGIHEGQETTVDKVKEKYVHVTKAADEHIENFIKYLHDTKNYIDLNPPEDKTNVKIINSDSVVDNGFIFKPIQLESNGDSSEINENIKKTSEEYVENFIIKLKNNYFGIKPNVADTIDQPNTGQNFKLFSIDQEPIDKNVENFVKRVENNVEKEKFSNINEKQDINDSSKAFDEVVVEKFLENLKNKYRNPRDSVQIDYKNDSVIPAGNLEDIAQDDVPIKTLLDIRVGEMLIGHRSNEFDNQNKNVSNVKDEHVNVTITELEFDKTNTSSSVGDKNQLIDSQIDGFVNKLLGTHNKKELDKIASNLTADDNGEPFKVIDGVVREFVVNESKEKVRDCGGEKFNC